MISIHGQNNANKLNNICDQMCKIVILIIANMLNPAATIKYI